MGRGDGLPVSRHGEGTMTGGGRPTSRLSGVSSTVTPASTLPTVRETNMAIDAAVAGRRVVRLVGVGKGQLLVVIYVSNRIRQNVGAVDWGGRDQQRHGKLTVALFGYRSGVWYLVRALGR